MRTGVSLSLAVILLGVLLAAPGSGQQQAGSWGPLTGIKEIGIRVPISGAIPGDAEGLDPRILHYMVRDFLTPRAPGISIVSASSAFRLEVRFSFRHIPPGSEEGVGFLILSHGWLESVEEKLAERDYAGAGPSPLHTVEGLKLWTSAPSYSFVEDEGDLRGEVNKLVEIHMNRFLDAWFRDNADLTRS